VRPEGGLDTQGSRSIELLRHPSSIPPQQGVGLGDKGDLLESFSTEPFRNLGQRGSLAIREQETRGKMGSKDAVLGDEVFIAEQQFLVDETGYEGQQARPVESIIHGISMVPIMARLQPALAIRAVF
jgi:hypothetical protein